MLINICTSNVPSSFSLWTNIVGLKPTENENSSSSRKKTRSQLSVNNIQKNFQYIKTVTIAAPSLQKHFLFKMKVDSPILVEGIIQV